MAYIDPTTGKAPKETMVGGAGKTEADTVKEADAATKEKGRYQISLSWVSGGGHRIVAERRADGTMMVYDPQRGTKYGTWHDFIEVAKKGRIHIKAGISILRTDDKLINTTHVAGIVKKP